jgi:hypothetical protein
VRHLPTLAIVLMLLANACGEDPPGLAPTPARPPRPPPDTTWPAVPAALPGRAVAMTSHHRLVVVDRHGGAAPRSPTIIFERYDQPWVDPQLHRIGAEALSMDEAEPLWDDDPPLRMHPTSDRQGRLVVVEQRVDEDGDLGTSATQLVVDPATGDILERRELDAGVRIQVHDPSGGYLLAILTDGTARWWEPAGQEGAFGEGLTAASC